MNERITNEIRRLIPHPWENLSPEEIEERENSIWRTVNDASKNSANDEQPSKQATTRTIVDFLEKEKPKAEGWRRRFIEILLRKLLGH